MYKALIVDDEPKILMGLSKLLQWEDFGIEIAGLAGSAAEALQMMAHDRITILITDINMPQMNGLELIHQIKARGYSTKFIILSGYDDFAYVKEAVRLGVENYLLKPVVRDELSSTLMNIIEKTQKEMDQQSLSQSDSLIIRNNILNRWLTGDISLKHLTERADLLKIELESEKYLVCLMKVLYDEKHDTTFRNRMNSSGEIICAKALENSGKAITVCDLNGNIAMILHGSQNSFDHHTVHRLLERCIQSVQQALKLSVFATIGCDITDSQAVYQSYENACQLMSYSLILPPNAIVDYDTMSQLSQQADEKLTLNYEAFQADLASKRRTEAIKFVEDIFLQLGQTRDITPAFVQNIATEILYHILNALDSLKINIAAFLSKDNGLIAQMLKMKNLEELRDWLKGITGKAIDIISVDDENIHPLIKRILTYIETHYADNISLKTISASVNANAAYLGQLFIKETNETFSNYLNHKRIEKAMELLRSTSWDLNEVAEKVGYVNQSYFNNVFKKIAGVYPTKYRLDHGVSLHA